METLSGESTLSNIYFPSFLRRVYSNRERISSPLELILSFLKRPKGANSFHFFFWKLALTFYFTQKCLTLFENKSLIWSPGIATVCSRFKHIWDGRRYSSLWTWNEWLITKLQYCASISCWNCGVNMIRWKHLILYLSSCHYLVFYVFVLICKLDIWYSSGNDNNQVY